jgi:hypothetical protein
MSPITEKSATEFDNGFFTIPQSFLLQVGTVSMIGLLLATDATTKAIIALGEASEELFRGSMLPILDFPENTTKG